MPVAACSATQNSARVTRISGRKGGGTATSTEHSLRTPTEAGVSRNVKRAWWNRDKRSGGSVCGSLMVALDGPMHLEASVVIIDGGMRVQPGKEGQIGAQVVG